MGILEALNERLAFIRWFYLTSALPFEAIRRQGIPRHDPEGDNLPDELERPLDAAKGLEVLGQSSLSLVAKAIQDYLYQFVLREAGAQPALTGKSRFEKYEKYLLDRTPFRWGDCPVGRDQVEQIILCRNDFQHDPFIDSSQPKQSERHFEKYPSSRFNDPLERAVQMAIAEVGGEEFRDTAASLTVTRQELMSAIANARRFCEFVETQKTERNQEE